MKVRQKARHNNFNTWIIFRGKLRSLGRPVDDVAIALEQRVSQQRRRTKSGDRPLFVLARRTTKLRATAAYSHVTSSINMPFAFGHLIYSVCDDTTGVDNTLLV